MTERHETRAKKALQEQIDRLHRALTTHADDCWSWGPGHYDCAVREIERLRKMHQDAYQRGLQAGSRGLREMYDAIQEVKSQDAWDNARLTEALMEAEERAERAEAENKRLQAEVERLRSMTAVTMGVGRGDGSLYVHGDYESIKAAQALVLRAERLEKALKDIRSLSSINHDPFALTVLLGDIHHIANTALAEENDNGSAAVTW